MVSAFFKQRNLPENASNCSNAMNATDKLGAVNVIHQQAREAATLPPSRTFLRPVSTTRWKPPATRRFLWDRTPQGQTVVSDLGNLRFIINAQPNIWHLLVRLHKSHGNCFSMKARVHSTSTRELHFLLDTGSPQAAESVWKVQLSEPNLSSQMTALQLQAAYEVSCSTQQGAGAAQLIQTACNSIITSDGRIQLQGYAACAAPVIRYTPILAKSISPQPLSKYLQSILRGTFSNPFQDGFLSMDQGRALVPLAVDDPMSYSVPLMGIWITGVDSIAHPFVAAACIKFLCNKALLDKAIESDKSFIVLFYPRSNTSVPLFYECHVGLENDTIPLKSFSFSAASHPNITSMVACNITDEITVKLQGISISVAKHMASIAPQRIASVEKMPSWQSPGSAGSMASCTICDKTVVVSKGDSPTISFSPGTSIQMSRKSHESSNVCHPSSGHPLDPAWQEERQQVEDAPIVSSKSKRNASGERVLEDAVQPTSTLVTEEEVSVSPTPMPHMDDGAARVQAAQGRNALSSQANGDSAKSEDNEQSAKSEDNSPAYLDSRYRAESDAASVQDANDQQEHVIPPGTILQSSGKALHTGSIPRSSLDDCSGSMPSFAGWSTSVQPMEAGNTTTSGNATSAQPDLSMQLQEHTGSPIGSDESPSQSSHLRDVDANTVPVNDGEAQVENKMTDNRQDPLLEANAESNKQQASLITDVAALQQEVLWLRQQVQLLHAQLQASKAMQPLPLMLPASFPVAYPEMWGLHSAGVQWVPQQLPALHLGSTMSAASMQYSSNLQDITNASVESQQYFSATTFAKDLPEMVSTSSASFDKSSLQIHDCAHDSIQAYQGLSGRSPVHGGDLTTGNSALQANEGAPQQQVDPLMTEVSDQKHCNNFSVVPHEVGVYDVRPCFEGGDGQNDRSFVGDVEADIDRLIADAERAVSVLSCYSQHQSGDELAADNGPPFPDDQHSYIAKGSHEDYSTSSDGRLSIDQLQSHGLAAQMEQSDSSTTQIVSKFSTSFASPALSVVRVKVPRVWEGQESDDSEDEDEQLAHKYGLLVKRHSTNR